MTKCSYCGRDAKCTADHVVPRCLYPSSRSKSRVQRITIPACPDCNGGWADDEAHFRNILAIAGGDPNNAVTEIWKGKIRRSFDKPDGKRRLLDVVSQLDPVATDDGLRHKVYPANDPRVMRIIRKIIRGLSHHHGLLSPVADDQVWADMRRWPIPPSLWEAMEPHALEEDIFSYRYECLDFDHDLAGMVSGWALTFFGRTTFIGAIYDSPEVLRPVHPDSEGGDHTNER